MQNQSDYPTPPEGFELHLTKTSLGKRCFCSHTEIGRLITAGELKPRGGGAYGSSHYSVEDLDRVRGHHYRKIEERCAALNGSERVRLAAQFAEVSALMQGRSGPSVDDNTAARIVADRMVTRKEIVAGLGSMHAQLTAIANGLGELVAMVAQHPAAGRSRMCAGPRMNMRVP
jgi:hypothetical protein